MRILAVDDEAAALKLLVESIKEVEPSAELLGTQDVKEAICFAESSMVEVAFLDISMRDMDGIQLARTLQKTNSKMNIIFVTGYTEYGVDAVKVHASGFLEKPVDAQDIKKAMENLLYPVAAHSPFYIKTFGNFEVMYKGKPLRFERSKGKELLAYLVDLQGDSATRAELTEVLFESDRKEKAQLDYFSKIYRSLYKVLQSVGQEHILVKEFNCYSVDFHAFESDLREYKEGTSEGYKLYRGSYMKQYSWAEASQGQFMNEM